MPTPQEKKEEYERRRKIAIGGFASCCCCAALGFLFFSLVWWTPAFNGTALGGKGVNRPKPDLGGAVVQALVPSPPPAPPSPPSPPSPPWFSVNGAMQYAYSYVNAAGSEKNPGGTTNEVAVRIFDLEGNELDKFVLYPDGVPPNTNEVVERRDLLAGIDWSNVGDFQFEQHGDDKSKLGKIFMILVFEQRMIRVMPRPGSFPKGGVDSIVFDAGTASGEAGVKVPTDKGQFGKAFCDIIVTGGPNTANAKLYAQIRGYTPGTALEDKSNATEALSPKVLVSEGLEDGISAPIVDILPLIWAVTDNTDFLYEDDAIVFTAEGDDLPDEIVYQEIKVEYDIFDHHIVGDKFDFTVPTVPGQRHEYSMADLDATSSRRELRVTTSLWG